MIPRNRLNLRSPNLRLRGLGDDFTDFTGSLAPAPSGADLLTTQNDQAAQDQAAAAAYAEYVAQQSAPAASGGTSATSLITSLVNAITPVAQAAVKAVTTAPATTTAAKAVTTATPGNVLVQPAPAAPTGSSSGTMLAIGGAALVGLMAVAGLGGHK